MKKGISKRERERFEAAADVRAIQKARADMKRTGEKPISWETARKKLGLEDSKPKSRRRAAAAQPPPAVDPTILAEIRALLLKIVSPLKPVPVQTPDSIVLLCPEDIAVVTSTESRNLAVHDLQGDVWTRFDTLAQLEATFAPDPRFFRCHKSFLVNLYAVRSLEHTKDGQALLTFRGKVQIKAKVSEANLKQLEAALGL